MVNRWCAAFAQPPLKTCSRVNLTLNRVGLKHAEVKGWENLMSVSRKRFRIEQAIMGDVPMPGRRRRRHRPDASRDHGRAALDPRPDGRRRRPRTRRGDRKRGSLDRARSRRSPHAAGNLSRPDRAVREAQGRARPHSRRHQPHQARNRHAARPQLRRRGNGQGQWRTRRRRRRHRRGHPADSRSHRGDRPGRQRAVQEHLAGPAEAAQRGNPGTRDLDLRGLQLPGSHRPAHQQGDDDDEVHRKSHQRR